MAESFASNIAAQVVWKLGSLAIREVGLPWGVKDDLDDLKDTISTVKALLLDAEEKQAKNHELTDWLGKLKDCFYEADDVLDEFEYHSLHCQFVSRGSIQRKVRNFFSSSNPLVFRCKMGRKIKEIRERLDKIIPDKSRFNLTERDVDAPVLHREREMTYSFVRASDVIGRDDDKKNIIKLLLQSSDNKSVSVVPIVGIGGLGKTTLAKLVYNDEKVVRHFEKRMWVCVSDDFEIKKLAKEIVTSATHAKCEDLPVDQLQNLLRNALDDTKFLLVLDDVWNTNRDKWLQLQALLNGGATGSKIVVTTRSKSVALMMVASPLYELEGLSQEECLDLFIKCAFRDGQDKEYPKLVEIGKDIVKRCGGLPLAVKTLGGLLFLKTQSEDWEKVRDNEIWKLPQKEDAILPALKLSYDELPYYLKQCFAFCSLFPKDHEFNNLELIQMWIVQGLIPSLDQNEEIEDVANRFIKELLFRCFFQDLKEEIPDFGYSFKMHDLVHDLASYVAQPECTALNFIAENNSTKVRHISILEDDKQEEVPRFVGKLSNVRTVLFPIDGDGPSNASFVTTCLLRFKYMRVLDLSNSNFEELPNSICDLKHLRYLDLSCNNEIKYLPNSICKLHHLQVLMLAHCDLLKELPRDIGKMMSLRHLTVTTEQKALPHARREVGRGCFNSLQNLAIMKCPFLESLAEGKQSLIALRTLTIALCWRLQYLPKHLPALENLTIGYCENLDLRNRDEESDGFGSLRVLAINELPKLEILPRWLLQGPASKTLRHLFIKHCYNFRGFSGEEGPLNLTSLETLTISNCRQLSVLPEGMRHLTSLRQLDIMYCKNLSALPEGMRDLRLLTQLKIFSCPQLIDRCKPRTGDDWDKIAHVPNIYLDDKKIEPEKIDPIIHCHEVNKSRVAEIMELEGLKHYLNDKNESFQLKDGTNR